MDPKFDNLNGFQNSQNVRNVSGGKNPQKSNKDKGIKIIQQSLKKKKSMGKSNNVAKVAMLASIDLQSGSSSHQQLFENKVLSDVQIEDVR